MTELISPQKADWNSLGLSKETLTSIEKAGFNEPTPVQVASIPAALKGKDLIVSAQTGTGKTASFVLPMVEKFAGRRGSFGLILAPTREIAQQIHATLDIFAKPRGLNSAVLIGGIDMKEDAKHLQGYPDIIVGTPGRICDHLERGNLWLEYIEIVVLDEADRMLSMGFADKLAQIMKHVPENRQTLMFSATFLPSVETLARKVLKNPVKLAIGKASSARASITQKVVWMYEEDKKRSLMRLLTDEPGSVMIFTRSKDSAQQLWLWLHSQGIYDETYLSSDRKQEQRELALAEFKSGKHRILVATDVGGRGIHVEGVAHVVNYDLPMDPEDYIHRIGRTGRADATGKATTFATPRDRRGVSDIERLLGMPIPSDGPPPERNVSNDGGRGGRPQGQRDRNGPRRRRR